MTDLVLSSVINFIAFRRTYRFADAYLIEIDFYIIKIISKIVVKYNAISSSESIYYLIL